jgi:hypothetical protein
MCSPSQCTSHRVNLVLFTTIWCQWRLSRADGNEVLLNVTVDREPTCPSHQILAKILGLADVWNNAIGTWTTSRSQSPERQGIVSKFAS